MNMFKAALKAVCKHPVYFLIYCVWMSTMGIFIANGLSVDTQEAQQFEESQSKFAIIDRDHSEVSLALTEHLAQSGTRVDVDDSTFAMQDAVAKDEVYALVIVPEHFGEDFLAFAEGSAPRQHRAYHGAAPQGERDGLRREVHPGGGRVRCKPYYSSGRHSGVAPSFEFERERSCSSGLRPTTSPIEGCSI